MSVYYDRSGRLQGVPPAHGRSVLPRFGAVPVAVWMHPLAPGVGLILTVLAVLAWWSLRAAGIGLLALLVLALVLVAGVRRAARRHDPRYAPARFIRSRPDPRKAADDLADHLAATGMRPVRGTILTDRGMSEA